MNPKACRDSAVAQTYAQLNDQIDGDCALFVMDDWATSGAGEINLVEEFCDAIGEDIRTQTILLFYEDMSLSTDRTSECILLTMRSDDAQRFINFLNFIFTMLPDGSMVFPDVNPISMAPHAAALNRSHVISPVHLPADHPVVIAKMMREPWLRSMVDPVAAKRAAAAHAGRN